MKKVQRVTSRVFAFAILLVTPLMSGCIAVVAAGAGAGAYAYLKGNLDSHLNAPLEECIIAVRETGQEMGLLKVKEVSDVDSAKFIFEDSLEVRTVVQLKQKQADMTSITLRVGNIGDESRSLRMLERINAQL